MSAETESSSLGSSSGRSWRLERDADCFSVKGAPSVTPPVGPRSMGGMGRAGLREFGRGPLPLIAANLTIVMLETPTAIANAEEIEAVSAAY
jgi:hypothetical protein